MIGIDWGTSSSSIGYHDGVDTRLLPVADGGATRLPSTAWIPRTPARDAPPDDTGRARVLAPQLITQGALRFGEDATGAMLALPEDGFYVKSPKSFLGAELRPIQIDNFTALVARMLGELLERAEAALGERPVRAVIGRPVRYHGTRGDAGDAQAIAIMSAAAHAAGLEDVHFLHEPLAAAWAYEAQLDRERRVLVIDAGGGTTDLTLVRLDPARARTPDRSADVLGTAGDRIGGTDLDARLAFRALTPLLGRESSLESGLPMPNHYYVDLCNVADVNAQSRFASEATREALEDYGLQALAPERLARLVAVQARRASLSFNRSAELAKIALSDAPQVAADLRWLEPGLDAAADRRDLGWAAEPLLSTIGELAADVIAQAGTGPETIFVTGGTALSPVVADGLRARLGAEDLVVGDLFGSVAAGLGLAAARRFG